MMNNDFYQLGMLLVTSFPQPQIMQKTVEDETHIGCLIYDKNDLSLEAFEL